MVEVIPIVVCWDCGVSWRTAGERPRCGDPSHAHGAEELHRHRSPVELPDGKVVVAVSFDDADPYARDDPPGHGLYLDPRWRPPWPHDHVDWPDFGVPARPEELVRALREVDRRAGEGARVELGCLGAHGRTGTALACLASLADPTLADPVAWVRDAYCARAVETEEQARFVERLRTAHPRGTA